MDPRRLDEVKAKQAYETAGQAAEAIGGLTAGATLGPNLLGRLHDRRRQLERQLERVMNSIQFCERNAALVEIVEVVLASREKCDPFPPAGPSY